MNQTTTPPAPATRTESIYKKQPSINHYYEVAPDGTITLINHKVHVTIIRVTRPGARGHEQELKDLLAEDLTMIPIERAEFEQVKMIAVKEIIRELLKD